MVHLSLSSSYWWIIARMEKDIAVHAEAVPTIQRILAVSPFPCGNIQSPRIKLVVEEVRCNERWLRNSGFGRVGARRSLNPAVRFAAQMSSNAGAKADNRQTVPYCSRSLTNRLAIGHL
nr:hypothetical protein CFP56_13080 [Quercus suber]